MIEAHIRALEQSTMIALTLFASQSKQIIIKIVDLKDILGLYCGIKVVIQCQFVDFNTLSQYIVIRIAIRPYLSQYTFWWQYPSLIKTKAKQHRKHMQRAECLFPCQILLIMSRNPLLKKVYIS